MLVAVTSVVAVGCAKRLHRTIVYPDQLATVDHDVPFLKVHMHDGSLYVLSPWAADDSARQVSGTGTHYDVSRARLDSGQFVLSIDSVSLFETNVARPSASVAALGVITALTAGVAIYCGSNPKACFGSCPTFYVTDGSRQRLQAEGFSASIAPGLEARDVDALFRARPDGRTLRVRMKNEAYETHVVRYVNVLAAPRAAGHRVFADDAGRFWSTTEPVGPSRCLAPEGDCAATLASFDERERTSLADSTNLAAREIIDLTFDGAPDAPALVLTSRQSLLPTYLLYQAFAYLGSSTATWLAALDRANTATAQRAATLVTTLGGIDVLVPDSAGGWDSVATVHETGPLASDVHLVKLPATTGPMRVRLRMARGAWRVDAAELVSVEHRVSPLRLRPTDVLGGHGDRAPEARAKLLDDDDNALVTFPGDQYTLVYTLPPDPEQYELFLDTKGYYLEWMRAEWLAEENPVRAAELFLDPAGSLRRLAPQYKRVEAQLETAFWRSKYAGN
jgi:hypothetical protein